MEKIRFWIRKTFGFSQKETNGFVILSALIILSLFLPVIVRSFYHSEKTVFEKDQLLLDSLVRNWKGDKVKRSGFKTPLLACTSFDPNLADEKVLQRMLGRRVSGNIVKYRSRGGKFYSSEQLKKIFGMTDTLYNSIKECIVIQDVREEKPTEKLARFDINRVDSIELRKIKGIGKVLSSRIIRFREKLGGFVSIAQFGEVYGLDTMLVEELQRKSFIADDFMPVPVNLNSAEPSRLYSHPYIGKDAAKKIINIRRQKGKLNLSDWKEADILPSEKLDKLLPYLEF